VERLRITHVGTVAQPRSYGTGHRGLCGRRLEWRLYARQPLISGSVPHCPAGCRGVATSASPNSAVAAIGKPCPHWKSRGITLKGGLGSRWVMISVEPGRGESGLHAEFHSPTLTVQRVPGAHTRQPAFRFVLAFTAFTFFLKMSQQHGSRHGCVTRCLFDSPLKHEATCPDSSAPLRAGGALPRRDGALFARASRHRHGMMRVVWTQGWKHGYWGGHL
jgi:hypothetical protein